MSVLSFKVLLRAKRGPDTCITTVILCYCSHQYLTKQTAIITKWLIIFNFSKVLMEAVWTVITGR